MTAQDRPDLLIILNVDEWSAWLTEFSSTSTGVWLALAKKGTTEPTQLGYQAALEEALCHGWIDGQRKSYDERIFAQRFTPRRARSIWSQRNVEIVARLSGEGRMRPGGIAEVERAQADGRWDRAYAGPASAEVPADLIDALSQNAAAQQAFVALRGSDRYSVLHPILTAPNPGTRARRIARLVDRLSQR